MPQGLDVTVWTIRPAFGLVKTKAQDIWPNVPPSPNMLVEYLWTTLVRIWAQGGQCLGEKVQNRPYWTESTSARRSVSVESSGFAPGESVETVSAAGWVTWAACADALILAVACLPSV